MGAGGMRAIAEVSAQRAHHLAQRLSAIDGFSLAHKQSPYLWEFVLHCPGDAAEFAAAMRERGIIAGLPLSRVGIDRPRDLLVCCTEMTPVDAIERYVEEASALAARSVRRVPVTA